MKYTLFMIQLYFYISYVDCEFRYFNVAPNIIYPHSLITTSYAITHPPGNINCEYNILDYVTKNSLIQNSYIINSNIPSSNTYNNQITIFLNNPILTKKVYIIKFHCKYHCINGADHDANIEHTLIIDKDYMPDDILKFKPKINYVNDNTEKIINYLMLSSDKQNEILLSNMQSLIDTVSDDIEFYLQQSILVNNFLTVTDCNEFNLNKNIKFINKDCSENLLSYHKNVLDKLSDVLKCEHLKDKIFKHSMPHKILSLSAINLIYQTSKSGLFLKSSFEKGNSISECLNLIGYESLKLLKDKLQIESNLFDNIANDYIRALSIVSSNSIDNLKENNNLYGNTTTDRNDSLLVDNITLGTKTIIDKGLQLIIKNNFTNFEDDKIITDNLILMKKLLEKKIYFNKSKSFYSDDGVYQDFNISNNFTFINISLPIDHMISEYSLQTAKLGIILYDKYPLLASNNKNYSNKVVSIKFYNENDEIQKVENLNHSINIIFQRPDKSYNTCLYYDEYIRTWNDKNCSSIELNEEFLLCKCNHLTDFTISKFNPIYIIEDIINVLAETNWMTGFDEFQFLNEKTAIVMYIYSFIMITYFIGLFFTIRYDLNPKRDKYYYYITNRGKLKFCEKMCFSKNMIVEEIMSLKYKTDKSIDNIRDNELNIEDTEDFKRNLYKSFRINETGVSDIDNNLLDNMENPLNQCQEKYHEKKITSSNPNILCSNSNIINKQSFLETNFYIRITSVFKILQEYNIYTALVMKFEYKLNKTDILSLIFFNLSLAFAICGLFSPCNSISGKKDITSNGDIILNRGLVVSILTLFIVKIPSKLIKMLLTKKYIYNSEKIENHQKVRLIFLYKHIIIYFLIFSVFIWCVINTTWIYLRNFSIGRENDFLIYFFTALIVKIITLLCMFLFKSILFYFIVKNSEVPKWKKFLITFGVILIHI